VSARGAQLAVDLPLRAGHAQPADDEPALVERLRAGDDAAFETLVNRYMRRAFSVAYRLLGQKEDAEDLVQEAFMAVLQRIDTFQAGRPFAPWFFRILVNRGLNARKSRSLRAVDEIPEATAHAGPSPEREAERTELRDRLRTAMETLPERQRTIVQLFDLEGFAGPEIAEILEISDGTVRWHLHEARKTLKKALAPYQRSE
jgi:RNA polymerase sigma-70 factor (ECF subfamily)